MRPSLMAATAALTSVWPVSRTRTAAGTSAHPAEERGPVHPRHAHVRHDDGESVEFGDQFQRRERVGFGVHDALAVQDPFETRQHRRLVVDQQHHGVVEHRARSCLRERERHPVVLRDAPAAWSPSAVSPAPEGVTTAAAGCSARWR